MKKSIGMIEFKSIAIAIAATDEMIKSANVELVLSTPICPGKYISIISGDIGAVDSSVKAGLEKGGIFVCDHYTIPNISPEVIPALSGCTNLEKINSIGIIESISAVSAIIAADEAIKASNIELIEVRIAKGLGGKGYLTMTGEVSSINSAVEACQNILKETGSLVASAIIASPTKEIVQTLL